MYYQDKITIVIGVVVIYTIRDYLQYYKNTSIKDVHWNAVDNMLCAILVYLPVKSFTGSKSMKEFYSYAQKFIDENKESMMVPTAYEVLELAYDSPRYKSMKVSNWENTKTTELQFGAAVFRIGAETIITYKGTDYSFIGWIENFRLAYEYPTRTHSKAIEYLKNNVKLLGDKHIHIVGHSKGGNLAMVAAMETNDRIFGRIQKIYNFDGPGFRKDEFIGEKYGKMSQKLVNVLPSGSIVGVLLNNENYTVVKSSGLAVEEHDLSNWNLFGECFIEAKLSGVGNRLHESTTKGIENLDCCNMEEALETIFESFEKDVTEDFSMSKDDIIRFIKNVKNIDPEVRKCIENIFEVLFKSNVTDEKKSFKLPWRRKNDTI